MVEYAAAHRFLTKFCEVPVAFNCQTSAPVTRLVVSFRKSSPLISPAICARPPNKVPLFNAPYNEFTWLAIRAGVSNAVASVMDVCGIGVSNSFLQEVAITSPKQMLAIYFICFFILFKFLVYQKLMFKPTVKVLPLAIVFLSIPWLLLPLPFEETSGSGPG